MLDCPIHCKKAIEIIETPFSNASTDILLGTKENPFYFDKPVSEVKLPHMIFSSDNCSCPAIKYICVDEGVLSFEKILIEYGTVDEKVSSIPNLYRMSDNNIFKEEITSTASNDDYKGSLSCQDLVGFVGENMEKDGDSRVSVTEIFLKAESQRTMNEAQYRSHMDDLKSLFIYEETDSVDNTAKCFSGKLINDEGVLEATDLAAGGIPVQNGSEKTDTVPVQNSSEKQDHSFQRVWSISTPVDSRLNESSDCKQHFRQNFNQAAQEENSTLMTASSNEKLEGALLSERTSRLIDLSVEDDDPQLSVSSTDHGSRKIDLSNPSYDNDMLHCGAFTSDIGTDQPSTSGFMVESTMETNEQAIVPAQNGVKTKEQVVNSAASVPSSFAYSSNGESDFSGPFLLSGPIINSGHIPYSGSISLRSESSTTSAHSFAFPILQTEWNISPVRMVAADRKKRRHQRCWKAFICCKS